MKTPETIKVMDNTQEIFLAKLKVHTSKIKKLDNTKKVTLQSGVHTKDLFMKPFNGLTHLSCPFFSFLGLPVNY